MRKADVLGGSKSERLVGRGQGGQWAEELARTAPRVSLTPAGTNARLRL